MAGLGRRTHYRKHLTDAVLNDLPEPKENERIAKVFATRGGNQFDVLLAHPPATTIAVPLERSPQLAILPTKFNKLIWLKRNDFVIVETGENEEGRKIDNDATNNNGDSGIRFIVSHILYKEQVKHLQKKGFWPENDPEFLFSNDDTDTMKENNFLHQSEGDSGVEKEKADEEDYYNDITDGIEYNTTTGLDDDDDFFVNTNRLASLKVCDSSSSSDSDD